MRDSAADIGATEKRPQEHREPAEESLRCGAAAAKRTGWTEPERSARLLGGVAGGDAYQERRQHLRYPERQRPRAMTSGAAARVADATGNWVDTRAPPWSRPYLRLSRLDRPIGSWLLLMPCWWSAPQAATWLVVQALIGLAVLLQFNRFAVMTGIASLIIVAIYPFMKRITWWPQIVLGLAFSVGAVMGFAVTQQRIDATALALYAGSIAWVIGYDTIYAHQDAEDDALIGIKSTALLFGARTKPALMVFYATAVALIGVALMLAGAGLPAWIGLAAFAAHLVRQIRRLEISDPALCLRIFKSNRDAGLLLFAGLLLDAVVRANS